MESTESKISRRIQKQLIEAEKKKWENEFAVTVRSAEFPDIYALMHMKYVPDEWVKCAIRIVLQEIHSKKELETILYMDKERVTRLRDVCNYILDQSAVAD